MLYFRNIHLDDGNESKWCVHDFKVHHGSFAPKWSKLNSFNFLSFQVIKTIFKKLLLSVFQVKQLVQMWLRILPNNIFLLSLYYE